MRMGKRAGIFAMVLSIGVVAAACGSSSSGGSTASASTTTATWAEQPQTPPNYIFPFMNLAFFSVNNSEQFQYLMYRPALLVRQRGHPRSESLRFRWPHTPTYNNTDNHRGRQPRALQVVERRDGDGAERHVLDEHAPRREGQLGRLRAGRHPRRREDRTSTAPTQLTFTLTGTGQLLLVHLQRAVPDHPHAQRLGHHAKGGAPIRVAVPPPPTGRPTPSAPPSTPSCPSRPVTTRPTRRRPTTRCPPTPPTRSGRWSTDHGS